MKTKLSCLEMSTFMFYIMRCFFIGITINNIVYIANQDSYLSIIIGFLIGFIPLLLFYYLSSYKKELNIVELIEHLLGPYLGKGINLILSVFILFLSTIIYWNFTTFIASQYLSDTPALAISFIFLFPTIYLLNKGIYVIAKSSVMMFYICIVLTLLPFIGLFFQLDMDNFLPFLYQGPTPVLKGSFIYLTNNVLPIFLLLIIPKEMVEEHRKLPKNLILFYIMTTILLFILFFLTLGIFGVNLTKFFQYPEFHLLKRASLFGFIQRIESTLSIQWILDLFMCNIIALYYVVESMRITFHIQSKKIYQIILITVSLFVSIASNHVFKNNTIGAEFLMFPFSFLLYLFFFLIPFFLILIAHMKRKTQ